MQKIYKALYESARSFGWMHSSASKGFFFFLNDMEDIRLHKYVELTLAIVLSFITINLVALTTQKTLPDKYVPKINII